MIVLIARGPIWPRPHARNCSTWLNQGHDLWVFFDNDIHGYVVQNATRLRDLIQLTLKDI